MKILGMDPSRAAFGWCLMRDPRGNVDKSSGTLRSETLEEMMEKLWGVVSQSGADLIVFEQARKDIVKYAKKDLFGGLLGRSTTPNAAQLILHQVEGAIRMAATACDIPYLAVPPQTWRKALFGKGDYDRNTAKKVAVEYLKRLKVPHRSIDEAESICVALYGWSTTEARLIQQQEKVQDGS